VTEELILTSVPYCASDAGKALLFGRGRIVKKDRPGSSRHGTSGEVPKEKLVLDY
jgi:hypothetical protein